MCDVCDVSLDSILLFRFYFLKGAILVQLLCHLRELELSDLSVSTSLPC